MRKRSVTLQNNAFTKVYMHNQTYLFQMGSVAIMARVYVINMTCVSQLVQ